MAVFTFEICTECGHRVDTRSVPDAEYYICEKCAKCISDCPGAGIVPRSGGEGKGECGEGGYHQFCRIVYENGELAHPPSEDEVVYLIRYLRAHLKNMRRCK